MSDARRIGMGGVGDWSNTAWDLVGQESDYRSIPIPLGLFQVFENLDVFNPDSDDFDPALVMSYASSPLHYTFSRGGTDAGRSFLLDIVNAEISRDLNAYRGFDPKEDLRAGGLAAPDWGRTFWVYEDGTASHGFYVGAGPYLSIETELVFDDRLVELWASEADIYFPNSSFTVLNETRTQGAGALTFGYRARLPLVGNTNSDRNGIYVATNYNYLYGIYYEDFDIDILFDTDDEGLLTLAPTTDPATIERFASADGRGFGIDVAAAVILDEWEFTGALDGIGNRIDWKNLRAKVYTLTSIVDGSDFEESSLPAPGGVSRVELPLRFSGGAAYDPGDWAVSANLSRGFHGFELNGGGEYRFGRVDVRGGGRYAYGLWHPAWGAGFDVTDGFGVDVAFFGSATNVERDRELGLALSLRLAR